AASTLRRSDAGHPARIKRENPHMRHRFLRLLAALFALTLVAAACGDDSSSDDASGDGSEEAAAGECEPGGDLPDLGGREVTVAVENAYLPFNYIDADTNEAAGW